MLDSVAWADVLQHPEMSKRVRLTAYQRNESLQAAVDSRGERTRRGVLRKGAHFMFNSKSVSVALAGGTVSYIEEPNHGQA
jgi:hypothetical protein